jgi:hypothetical protein
VNGAQEIPGASLRFALAWGTAGTNLLTGKAD